MDMLITATQETFTMLLVIKKWLSQQILTVGTFNNISTCHLASRLLNNCKNWGERWVKILASHFTEEFCQPWVFEMRWNVSQFGYLTRKGNRSKKNTHFPSPPPEKTWWIEKKGRETWRWKTGRFHTWCEESKVYTFWLLREILHSQFTADRRKQT